MLNRPEFPLCTTRTPYWTDDLVRDLDARNVQRMRCLPPMWQRHVVLTYSTDGAVRDVQKHVSGTIGGVRRLIFGGMTQRESVRLQDLAATGVRVSYQSCDEYWYEGRCKYGEACTHSHMRRTERRAEQ